ncbi:putative toxin biosynthesis protein [Mycena sanguinolenta]|uniref:Putative toxin biosynthesis protein n=1 Tax=Mycena sanguinolenta TaxID=230812 RepID=A0A8H6XX53_9AGAR|nr:putative toxin biosynthesis protein [Mycena sanguinolenta]
MPQYYPHTRHPNVHPVKLTSGDKADNEAAIAEIKETAGQLDVIIASAGISKQYGRLATASLSDGAQAPLGLSNRLADHSVHLYRCGVPSTYYHMSASAYAASKAAANFLIKVLDAEHSALISMAIHPGWVATDIGNIAAASNRLSQAPVTVKDSVAGVLSRIDRATKEKSSGRFWNFKAVKDGMPWDVPTEEVLW